MSEAETERAVAGARADGYWRLAQLLARLPPPELLEEIAAESDGDANREGAVASLLGQLRDVIRQEPVESLLGRLAPEYTRLLGGVNPTYGPPPPYESVYRGGQFMGDVTLSVMNAFSEAGIAPLDDSLGPCDHLASELLFMSALCVMEGQAHGGDDPAATAAWLDRQRSFLESHILAWVPSWCSAIRAETKEPYFTCLADLVLAACRSDAELLAQRSLDEHY